MRTIAMGAQAVERETPEKSRRRTGVYQDPELWLYRERTIAMLRQYFRLSIEVGRLPSILGREFFRSKVTSYRMASFEDAVIFVHDVERALERLAIFHQQVIAVVVFQECTQEQAAEILQCARRTVSREFPEAVDRVSEIFLSGGLLNRLPTLPVEKTCQEAVSGEFPVSDCKQLQ
jgi:predicted DNA-binding protein (UPF0251 family)